MMIAVTLLGGMGYIIPVWLVAGVLFAVATLGHLVIVLAWHNWVYGQNLPRHSGKIVHLVFGILFLAGPILLMAYSGWDLTKLSPFDSLDWGQWLTLIYVCCCYFMGAVWFPAITLQRLTRPIPKVQVSSESKVFDLEKEKGSFGPLPGKRGLAARLPWNEVHLLDITRRTLRLARLPKAWDGLTILQIGDMHFHSVPTKAWHEAVMDHCAALEPDIVAFTGDLVDSIPCQEWIAPVLGRLRYRIAAFAVLGNHDYWFEVPNIRANLTKAGLRVLSNRWEQLEVRGEPMLVIGTDYPYLLPSLDLTQCPTGPFRLCLSHTPDNLPWARRAGIDLMLSGHVHGGQIRFPIIGSVLVPSIYGRRYDCGLFHEGPTVLHVSRGLSGDQPLRFGCKPEATLLTLRSGT
jgi:predicted MPP superfamily phosphohydrolase